MATINLDLLSDEDYKAYTEKRYSDLSPDAQNYLGGEGFGTAESFLGNAGQGFSSSLRGLAGMLPENDIISIDKEADLENERRSRMMLETNPLSGWAGLLVGSALDPVTLPAALLKPLTIGGSVATGALRGSAAGTFGGVIEPVYEEMGDSRVMNILGGAGLGAGLGGLFGKLFGKGGTKAATEAETDAAKVLSSEDPAKAISDLNTDESVVTKTLEPALPENAVFNQQTKQFEVMEEVTPTVNLSMPRQLAGAKPRFNTFQTEFSNDLDKALYIVGKSTTKSAQHEAYMDWLRTTTNLSDPEIKQAAKTARGELVKQFGVATPTGNKLASTEPTTTAKSIIDSISAPRKVGKPIKPQVTIKDGLDDNDLNLLRKAGVNVNIGRNGTLVVQDTFASNKVMSNVEFLRRMEAAGIGIDLPAYRQRTRADTLAKQATEREQMMTPEFWTKQQAPAPERAPVFDKQTWTGNQPMAPSTKEAWTTPPTGRTEAPLATGAPRDSSMGAASTRPATLYGEALTPKELKPIPKIELANRALSMSLEDFVKLVPRREMEQLRKQFPDDVALERYLKEGQEKLKNILKNNNNIVEWMLKKSKSSNPLSNEEVGAFAPFYYRAMAAREAVLQKALEHRRAGGSFESAEGAQLVEDLMYYTGVALFKKEAGSKAGRALNAFNLFSQKNATGQRLKNMFPGVAC